MKRFLCLILAAAMILSLFGCGSAAIVPVSFYYCREPDSFIYFTEDSVIRSETRDLMGHQGDLRYMVSLYLAGPLEEGLVCPFPRDTRLVSAIKIGDTIRIELSDLEESISDIQFSLACGCLAMTCMDFSSCTEVIITSGSRSANINSDNLVLFDAALPEEASIGGTQ